MEATLLNLLFSVSLLFAFYLCLERCEYLFLLLLFSGRIIQGSLFISVEERALTSTNFLQIFVR